MRFGPLPIDRAKGAILAHSVVLPGGRLRKGCVLDEAELIRLRAAGVTEVMVALLDPADVAEDIAADRLARALVPAPEAAGLALSAAFTGRVNLNARCPGLMIPDAAAIHAMNRVHPAITLATLAPYARVAPGQLVATVKIITYSVPEAALVEACHIGRGALRVQPVVRQSASLILTEVPELDPKLAAKGRRAIEGRLRALGIALVDCVTVPHQTAAVAQALAEAKGDLLLILTGSATSDPQDVAPEGLRRAGGQVQRFGMPVDPGNLLFFGALEAKPVIGLPGCARSPALNGADWVLERFACGLSPSDDDIAAMGVGGLLKEIPLRGHLRETRTE
ncbi:MAG: molybdopterin-binding protein [Tabrizicola sp.]|nr:molybdopterin-binding protein [Tabrizicola sp.]